MAALQNVCLASLRPLRTLRSSFLSPCRSLRLASPPPFASHLASKWNKCPSLLVDMRIKEVETFDGSFELQPECDEKLRNLLNSETFRNQVGQQAAQQPDVPAGSAYEFTGELFQPVPWSITTKHGMPQELEKYLNKKEYVIINIPPNFMFQAKIFKPSRLCAVFKRVGDLLSDTSARQSASK